MGKCSGKTGNVVKIVIFFLICGREYGLLKKMWAKLGILGKIVERWGFFREFLRGNGEFEDENRDSLAKKGI